LRLRSVAATVLSAEAVAVVVVLAVAILVVVALAVAVTLVLSVDFLQQEGEHCACTAATAKIPKARVRMIFFIVKWRFYDYEIISIQCIKFRAFQEKNAIITFNR
jgi:hypothetical protein